MSDAAPFDQIGLAGLQRSEQDVGPGLSATRYSDNHRSGNHRIEDIRATVRQPQTPGAASARPDAASADAWAREMRAIAEAGDRQAYARVFCYYAPRVKAYAARLGGRIDLDELVQDVMLTIWRRAATFDAAQACLSTWIFTIARNRRIDMLRKDRRAEIDPDDPALLPQPQQPADAMVERAQWRVRLGGLIDTLPVEQADLLRRQFFQDKTQSMIADEMDLPLGTVKSRLRLALIRLRRAIGDPETS